MTGFLRIVGLGPGAQEWLTPEATLALQQASDFVGYGPYLARLMPRADQSVHASDNREELARARHALMLAAAGRRVVLASGGDPGVFAMASAVFEVMAAATPLWDDLDIKIVPGISAMQAAAARLGAPLGHDFCVLSLSDNLKPWAIIEKRLRAAIIGDFVLVFYNPASKARPERIFAVFDLLKKLLPSTSVVALAKAIGRPQEQVIVGDLSSIDVREIDMTTLVVIGSSKTRKLSKGWVFTPRFYEQE